MNDLKNKRIHNMTHIAIITFGKLTFCNLWLWLLADLVVISLNVAVYSYKKNIKLYEFKVARGYFWERKVLFSYPNIGQANFNRFL